MLLRKIACAICGERVWPDSFAGPLLKFVAQADTIFRPESSKTVWSAPFVNDGASLTGVIAKLAACVPVL